MNRNPLVLFVVAAGLSTLACEPSAKDPVVQTGVEQVALPGDQQVPESAEEFLARLMPVVGQGVRVVYEVRGPGGLAGSLEVMARPGGFRRENWTLRRTTAGKDQREIRGTTIQTPVTMWSGLDGEPGVKANSPIAALGAAYIALDPAGRTRVTQSIGRWHADLERARAEHPGDRREVAGVDCLSMRIAGQSLCLWEQTGLVLEYQGAEFRASATRVERDVQLPATTFALPAGAGAAREVSLPPRLRIDARTSIDALADGDYASLSLVLTPGLRLPLPEDGQEW